MKILCALSIAALSGLFACASTEVNRQLAQPVGTEPTPVTITPKEPLAASAAVRPKDTIYRTEIDAVLDQSPGLFFQKVGVEPFFVGGRFAGWQITSFFAGDNRFSDVDLRPGDVITRVNGMSLERPDTFMRVWQAMRSVDTLVVERERGADKQKLSWKIVAK